MFIEQVYTGCLNEAAYFIESNGEAIVIDPLREPEVYLDLSKNQKANIKYIFVTHFHSDFVSGHLELSKKTGATIVFGPLTDARFDFHLAKDGEVFKVGNVTIEAIHTPGHTPESTSYLLRDKTGKTHCLFTGDTLLAGEVGKPDISSGNLSREELTALLYQTLQKKILPLGDDIILYPVHLTSHDFDQKLNRQKPGTIGMEKKRNFALQSDSAEDFIKAIGSVQDDIPAYFPNIAKLNKNGYSALKDVWAKSLTPINIKDFTLKSEGDYTILDTRNSEEFTRGFIPGSISIGLEGNFEVWSGQILPYDRPILLITKEGKEKETITRLARVGFENVTGYLEGGFQKWKETGKKIDLVIDIEADELAMDLPFDDNLLVLDVRYDYEFTRGHIKEATNLPLSEMTDLAQIADIEEDQNIYLHSSKGYRSVIAASLLKKQGYHNLRNVLGGYEAIKEQPSIITESIGDILN